MAAAILKLPENSATEVLLVYKYTKSESVASLETGTDVSLEVRMTFLSFFFLLKMNLTANLMDGIKKIK